MRKLLLAALLLPSLAQAGAAIAMKKQVLNVSALEVSADLELLNESGGEVEQTIVFSLMTYPSDMGTDQTSYRPDATREQKFWLKVDGKPVAFKTTVEALFQGRRVEAQLRQIGLTDEQITFHSPSHGSVKALTAGQRQQLEKLGLLGSTRSEVNPTASWTVSVNYSWHQKFPANKIVKVHHQYRPVWDYLNGKNPPSPEFAKKYCADKDFFNGWKKLQARHGENIMGDFVSHPLRSGNTWKNGIEDFTLNVVKSVPADLISLCFPGKFKKIDNLTYQVHLSNYHPAQDLDVYFGRSIMVGGGLSE